MSPAPRRPLRSSRPFTRPGSDTSPSSLSLDPSMASVSSSTSRRRNLIPQRRSRRWPPFVRRLPKPHSVHLRFTHQQLNISLIAVSGFGSPENVQPYLDEMKTGSSLIRTTSACRSNSTVPCTAVGVTLAEGMGGLQQGGTLRRYPWQ